jgi:hypothetical protein
MTNRRTLFVSAPAFAATLIAGGQAHAEDKPDPSVKADFLFVQTAASMTFDKAASKLTLQGVSPITLFFSDRPDRIAGNMKTAKFVPFWITGKDSFSVRPTERGCVDP